MSGIKVLVDSNFINYIKQKNLIIEPFIDKDSSISFVSEMELLGVFSIFKNHKNNMQNLINDCQIFEMNQTIKFLAIVLKQKYKIKLAD